MRWLKHLALANEDEKTAALIDKHGPEGYGMYWLLLESVAASMQPKSDMCELTYSELRWSQKLRSSIRKTRSVVQTMHDLRLISAQTTRVEGSNSDQSTGKRLRIAVPNLLKYRDEYSEKSRQNPDKLLPSRAALRGRADTETEGEQKRSSSGSTEASIETGKEPPPPLSLPFWRLDESYAPLVAAWQAAKPEAIDEDFARNHKYWTALDRDQQEQAIGRLLERAHAGLQTSTTLGYWLREDYKRAVVETNGHRNGARAPDRDQKRREEANQIAKVLRRG